MNEDKLQEHGLEIEEAGETITPTMTPADSLTTEDPGVRIEQADSERMGDTQSIIEKLEDKEEHPGEKAHLDTSVNEDHIKEEEKMYSNLHQVISFSNELEKMQIVKLQSEEKIDLNSAEIESFGDPNAKNFPGFKVGSDCSQEKEINDKLSCGSTKEIPKSLFNDRTPRFGVPNMVASSSKDIQKTKEQDFEGYKQLMNQKVKTLESSMKELQSIVQAKDKEISDLKATLTVITFRELDENEPKDGTKQNVSLDCFEDKDSGKIIDVALLLKEKERRILELEAEIGKLKPSSSKFLDHDSRQHSSTRKLSEQFDDRIEENKRKKSISFDIPDFPSDVKKKVLPKPCEKCHELELELKNQASKFAFELECAFAARHVYERDNQSLQKLNAELKKQVDESKSQSPMIKILPDESQDKKRSVHSHPDINSNLMVVPINLGITKTKSEEKKDDRFAGSPDAINYNLYHSNPLLSIFKSKSDNSNHEKAENGAENAKHPSSNFSEEKDTSKLLGARLEAEAQRWKEQVSKLKAALQEEKKIRKEREAEVVRKFHALRKKHEATCLNLNQLKADKFSLLSMVVQFDEQANKEAHDPASRSEFALEQARHQIANLTESNHKMDKELDSKHAKIGLLTKEVTALKEQLSSGEGSPSQELKAKELQHQIKEKIEENASLQYRLQSVFDIVKKKQEDEEALTNKLRNLVDYIKACLEFEDAGKSPSPQSELKGEVEEVISPHPMSFYSNRSKSEADFDHKELIALHEELERLVPELIKRYSEVNLQLTTHQNQSRHEDITDENSKQEKAVEVKLFEPDKDFSNKGSNKGVKSQPGAHEIEVSKDQEQSQHEAKKENRLLGSKKDFIDSLQKLVVNEDDGDFYSQHECSIDHIDSVKSGCASPDFGVNRKTKKNEESNMFGDKILVNNDLLLEPRHVTSSFEPPMPIFADIRDSELGVLKGKIEELETEKAEKLEESQILKRELDELRDRLTQTEQKLMMIENTKEEALKEQVEREQELAVEPKEDLPDLLLTSPEEKNNDSRVLADTSELTIEEKEFDWKGALWKCYLAAVRNECDEHSEHLKIRELAGYIIERINDLHEKSEELKAESLRLNESLVRKDKRLEKLIDETNQAEDIIKELVEKCDKLEQELGKNPKEADIPLEEMSVSDFLHSSKKDNIPQTPIKDSSSELLILKDKNALLEEKISSLEKIRKAQSNILDSLIREIVSYQTLMKNDRDKNPSVHLALSILDKILKVLDLPSEAENNKPTFEAGDTAMFVAGDRTKEDGFGAESQPEKEFNGLPSFGAPMRLQEDPHQNKEFLKTEKKIEKDVPSETNRSKSIRQIRLEVEAHNSKVRQMSVELSSRKKESRFSSESSYESTPIPKLLVFQSTEKLQRIDVQHKYDSEHAPHNIQGRLDFDSVHPQELGQRQIFMRKPSSKKLTTYPDQYNSIPAQLSNNQPVDATPPKYKNKIDSMEEIIRQLKERIEQNLFKINLMEQKEKIILRELEDHKLEMNTLKKQLKTSKGSVVSSAFKTDEKKIIHVKPQADKWSISLTNKPARANRQTINTSSKSPSRHQGDKSQYYIDSEDTYGIQLENDPRQSSSSVQKGEFLKKIEKSLVMIQVKLMELINKNYVSTSSEATSLHRDMKLRLTSVLDVADRLLAELHKSKDQELVQVSNDPQSFGDENLNDPTWSTVKNCIDNIKGFADKGKGLGDTYVQLDEAALKLFKCLGSKSKSPAMIKIKDFLKMSESEKAKIAADSLLKAPKIGREKIIAYSSKLVDIARKEHENLQKLVNDRRVKLGQLCITCGESLATLFPV